MIRIPVKPILLYLIRHGETEWSLARRHTGWTDIPLTKNGEAEAQGLVERLSTTTFDHVLSSPLQRARRTCALAGLSESIEIYADLAEWDYGDYEGKKSVEIRKRREDWNIFEDGCPHGEMPTDVSDRADRIINHLKGVGGTIALFSHGQFGCVLATRWIGLAVVEAQHLPLDPASISILGYDPHHLETPTIREWNVTTHKVELRLPDDAPG